MNLKFPFKSSIEGGEGAASDRKITIVDKGE